MIEPRSARSHAQRGEVHEGIAKMHFKPPFFLYNE